MLDELTSGCKTPQDVEKLFSQMLQHMINRSLEAEMQAHVGHAPHGRSGGNVRNGKSRKTVQSAFGELQIETPRDRAGTFAPQLVKKRQVRLAGMEEKILALYARGMTTRDIESALVDLYGVEISHALIAQVTDAVLEEARAWQSRPLEPIYPIVWLDGIVVKVQHNKQVINKAAHVVLGVNLRGEKEVLGLWLAEHEGAKYWLSVLTELRHRGVRDIYIACMDGLKGLPEAVQAVFPQTLTQLCIVHLVRASLRYVNAGDSKAVVAALKRIYQSATAEEAAAELEALDTQWGDKYRAVVRLWRGNWDNIIPFFQFVPQIRKVIYTTNAIESLNMVMRKLTRNRRIFPNDDSALKSLFLAVREASKNWRSIHHWKPALQSFQVMFGEERVPMNAL
ncbi:IS256-like element IS1113 family transposase [Xanthomonas oryzae pv. oryzae]|uniref:IS256-like element IS1113 family transposase n=1 Tax=Xanthomonas oryzae TaxID=347 RepID=UPI000949E25E|nr:IS256-like element IS1113 family transposase [Xanthomonas oryzae]AXM13605.1 IS256-like element IS1113 family transposase [Xanthomonas oryzae pv. oryzae]AXM15417.1 IS256-like element IS1113 family transposase [Xanthomonas oryzae pv. oryzae]UWU53510.1 IS256-like element IS1113 family transposase [Xanthomonas oryzae pv. oryzae]UWU55018.1 IS256-like element IS1113 family transposase [Xanthomonas oryzae pv. oryzae]UWU55083.1 IS256-like element IS1113 family transposase [Xanthomonas oryzae pv. or